MRQSNSSQQSHSKKRRKKERDKSSNSNSHKKKSSSSSSKPSRPRVPNRPNSAKKFDEFFSDNMPPPKPKRSVPPPPPSSKKQSTFNSINAPPPNQSRSINSINNRNSHSSSHHSSIHSHQSISSLPPQSPQHITENVHLTSAVSTDSMTSHKNLELPMGIPVYQLQTTADSNISTDYSPVNGEDENENENDDRKEDIMPIRAALVAKSKGKKFAKKHNLKMHRSFNTLPPANIKRIGAKNPNKIRKNKSYGDQLKPDGSFSDDEYGLSLDQIYQQFNLNDPAVQKLKHLQTSMRRTQQSSHDLEQLLSATPPSLPPTPKLDNNNNNNSILTLQKSKSNSLSSCINKYFPEYNSSSNTLNHSSSKSTSNGKMLPFPNIPKHPSNNNTMIIKEDVGIDDIVMQYSDVISPINDHNDSNGNLMDNDDDNDDETYFDQMRKKKSVDMNMNIQLLQRIDDTEIDNNVAFAFPNPSHFDYIHNVLLSSNDKLKSKSTPTTPTPHKYNNYKNQSNPRQISGSNGNKQNNGSSEDNKLSTRFNFGRERSLSDSSSKYAALSLRDSTKSKYSDTTIKNMKRQYRNRKNTHLKVHGHGKYQHNSTVTQKFGIDIIDLYDFVFNFNRSQFIHETVKSCLHLHCSAFLLTL